MIGLQQLCGIIHVRQLAARIGVQREAVRLISHYCEDYRSSNRLASAAAGESHRVHRCSVRGTGAKRPRTCGLSAPVGYLKAFQKADWEALNPAPGVPLSAHARRADPGFGAPQLSAPHFHQVRQPRRQSPALMLGSFIINLKRSASMRFESANEGLSTFGRIMMSRRNAAMVLNFSIAMSFAPNISFVMEDLIAKATEHTDAVINIGRHRHDDIFLGQIGIAPQHADAANKEQSKPLTRGAIRDLMSAIELGKAGKVDAEIDSADSALDHVSHARSPGNIQSSAGVCVFLLQGLAQSHLTC